MLGKAATKATVDKTTEYLVTRAPEVRRLRITPVGVVEEKKKLRVIHDLTFDGRVAIREKMGTGE